MRFIYTKAFAIFFAFLLLAIGIAFLEVTGYDAPIRSVVLNAPRPIIYIARGITLPIKNFFVTIYSLKKIARDNSQLQSEVFELQQQLVGLDQTTRENEALKNELGFVGSAKQTLQPCTIVSQNPLGLTDALILNCGINNGVAVGQAVLSQGYMIGKVVYVTKSSSTVLLITSSQFSTDARISKTGKSAVIKGSFGSGIILDQLAQQDESDKGLLVVTAGINNSIPKDILIGQIGDVISSPNELFKRVTIISPIDFSNLQFAFVVIR